MTIVICRHEAAHGVTAWFLGRGVYRLQVTTEVNQRRSVWPLDRNGRELYQAAGHTEYDRDSWWNERLRQLNGALTIRTVCSDRLAMILAGPVMTALDTGQSLSYAFQSSGLDDRQNVMDVRSVGKIGSAETHRMVIAVALFLTSPPTAKAIREISSRLMIFGKVNKAQIDRICTAAFVSKRVYDPCSKGGIKKMIDYRSLLALEINKHSTSAVLTQRRVLKRRLTIRKRTRH